MANLLYQVPSRLIAGGVVGLSIALLVGAGLFWHAIRRIREIPRVPRSRTTYLLLAGLWAGLSASLVALAMIVLLLRDHQSVNGRTELAELRCETMVPGHLRAELTTVRSGTIERYDLQGASCSVSVVELNLRPVLGVLGVGTLFRIEGIGPIERPWSNPDWLTPSPFHRRPLLSFIVRDSHRSILTMPSSNGQRFALVASPGGPELEKIPG